MGTSFSSVTLAILGNKPKVWVFIEGGELLN
jgi:hypothetical protein